MRLVFIILLSLVVGTSVLAKINPSAGRVEKKNKMDPKSEFRCCTINHDSDDLLIRVNSVCLSKNRTRIEMSFLTPARACTLLSSNVMEDNHGKRYNPTSHSGLSECPSMTIVRKGSIYYWEFELLDRGVTEITLKEEEEVHKAMNLIPVFVKKVDLSHCKFY